MNTARQIQWLERLYQSLFSCLSQRSTAAAACGGFAAERCADWIYRLTAVGTQAPSSNGAAARRSAANAGSVTWTAELTRLNTDGPCLNRILLAGSSFSQGVVIRHDLFAILVRVCPFRVGLKLQKERTYFYGLTQKIKPGSLAEDVMMPDANSSFKLTKFSAETSYIIENIQQVHSMLKIDGRLYSN